MKKIYLTLLSLLALGASSCNDFLDVRPSGEKVENEQFETAKGFEDAINGVYGYMTDENIYGKEFMWGVPEILAQNLTSNSPDNVDLASYKYKDNSDLRNRFYKMWSRGYTAVGYINNVLQNLEKKSPDAFPLYDMYKGEMLGVRAMLHFDLLRFFAPKDPAKRGIPYVTSYSFSVKPFSTVGECFNYIIKDLTDAEKLLEAGESIAYPRDDSQYLHFNRYRESHMNLYAVKALLARVYWYMGDNANASKYAEEVIASNLFPLVDVTEVQDYLAGYLSPKETIFGLYSPTFIDITKSYLFVYQSYHSYTTYDNESGAVRLLPWQALYALDIEGTTQDFRTNQFRTSKSSSAKCFKLVDYKNLENGVVNKNLISGFTLIHSSEIYLIAADALLQSNYAKALEYFNAEITSRGLTPLRPDQTLTAERIFNEYRKEMFCEGQHWFNMKRINADITSNYESRVIPGNDEIYVLPIPEEEFEYRPESNK